MLTVIDRPRAHRVRIGDIVAMPRFVEWRVIVADIMAALELKHQSDVADLVNVPRTTLGRWVDGGEAGYGYGDGVLELHKRACGEAATLLRLTEFKERAKKAAN